MRTSKRKPPPSLLLGIDWVYRASAALPIGEKKVAMGSISLADDRGRVLKASTASRQTWAAAPRRRREMFRISSNSFVDLVSILDGCETMGDRTYTCLTAEELQQTDMDGGRRYPCYSEPRGINDRAGCHQGGFGRATTLWTVRSVRQRPAMPLLTLHLSLLAAVSVGRCSF